MPSGALQASESSGENNDSDGEVELIRKLEAAEKEAAELRQRLNDAEVAAAATKPRRTVRVGERERENIELEC